MNENTIIVMTPAQVVEVVRQAVTQAMQSFTGAQATQAVTPKIADFPDVMDLKEAHQYLTIQGVKMAETSLYAKVRDRELQARKAGGRLIFNRADLDSFLKSYIKVRPSIAEPIRESARRKV